MTMDLLLTDQERDRFAAWLEHEAMTDKGIIEQLEKMAKVDYYDTMTNTNWRYQLGTLGSGNHFIELCFDADLNVWIMLHSGSRGIGNKIGRYFIEQAKEDGFCSTLFGRQRKLPGVFSPYRGDVAACERQTKNSPIQGTAAEVAKLAMLAIHRNDYLYMVGAEMTMQVHDEILIEVPKDCVGYPRFFDELENCMMRSMPKELRVPLETSTKYGRTWLEAK
jgi:hypothetical protein